MTEDQLRKLEDDAVKLISLKTTEAGKGHDWVTDQHIFSSWELLELVSLAKRGYGVWKGGK